MLTLRQLWDHVPGAIKHALDALSLATLLGSLVSMLPAIASLLTIVWTAVRLFDEPRVQRWLGPGKKSGNDHD